MFVGLLCDIGMVVVHWIILHNQEILSWTFLFLIKYFLNSCIFFTLFIIHVEDEYLIKYGTTVKYICSAMTHVVKKSFHLFLGDLEHVRVFFYQVMTCKFLNAPMVAVAVAGIWPQCLYRNSSGKINIYYNNIINFFQLAPISFCICHIDNDEF